MNMNLKLTTVVGLTLFAQNALSQLEKIDLSKALSPKNTVDVYNPKLLTQQKSVDALSKMKFHEIHLQWAECSNLGDKLFETHKDLQGWIARSWLHCLSEEQKKSNNTAKLEKALHKIDQRWTVISTGPWGFDLNDSFFYLKMSLAEKNQQAKKYAVALQQAESLMVEKFPLTTDQNYKLYEFTGDLYQQLGKDEQALYLWQRAYALRKVTSLSDKIKKIKGEMPVAVVANAVNELQGDDVELAKRIDRSLAGGDSVTAIKDIVELFNRYPGSVVAKKYSTKPLELYNSLSGLASKKGLSEMSKAHFSKVLPWAESLHQRADYVGALVLLEDLIKKSEGSDDLTKMHWMAGRSAQFVGDYEIALQHFQVLIDSHQGTDESLEAYFRTGLIYLRKNEPSSAVIFFDKLLVKGDVRYDLSARYWLYRALALNKSDRAKDVGSQLIEKYPYSYYGLKLAAEANSGKADFKSTKEKLPVLDTEFYITGDRKSSWNRFKKLSQYGWVGEAQSELSNVVLPDDPLKMIAWAKVLSAHQQYVTAIRLINSAMEQDPELRRKEFMEPGFPNAFASVFKAEGDRYQLDSVLLKSLTRQESAFNLSAISRASAMGLMQMIPGTAKEVAQKMGLKITIPEDMYRPEVNIPMGTFYINQMIEQFSGNVPFALAAYNAGPSRFKLWMQARTEVQSLQKEVSQDPLSELWFDEVPWRETSFYVKAILRNSIIYKMMDGGPYEVKANFWQEFVKKKSK